MITAVCGGKGGTGKSTFSLYLALKRKALLVDTDVENPSLHAIAGQEIGEKVGDLYVKRAELEREKCSKCGLCARKCRFNAIFWAPGGYPVILEELCEGCGVCEIACPQRAMRMKRIKVGEVYLSEGKLRILTAITGEEGGKIVPQLIEYAKKMDKEIILDCPAGLHCNALHQMVEADEVFVVVEHSPLGFQALKETLKTLKELGKGAKVVVNKATGNINEFERAAREFGAEVVRVIPYKDEIARAYAEGRILEVME